MPGKAQGSQVSNQDCGTNSLVLLASWDHDSSSWKMSQQSFLADSETYSESVPASGMMRNGELFAPPLPAPRTEGNECSLCGTPRASGGAGNAKRRAARGMLEGQIGVAENSESCPPLNPSWVESLMGFPGGWTDGPQDQVRSKGHGKRLERAKLPPTEPRD